MTTYLENLFHTYSAQCIETAIVLLSVLAVKLIMRYFVRLTVLNSYVKIAERKDVLRLINLILMVLFGILVTAIWGVKQEQLLLFASSIITVLGVALFAEMSILSNVTACLILFFQHPVKVGDTVCVVHEGLEVEGELMDITYFFMFIKTSDKGVVTVPNALLLKSAFSVMEKSNHGDKN